MNSRKKSFTPKPPQHSGAKLEACASLVDSILPPQHSGAQLETYASLVDSTTCPRGTKYQHCNRTNETASKSSDGSWRRQQELSASKSSDGPWRRQQSTKVPALPDYPYIYRSGDKKSIFKPSNICVILRQMEQIIGADPEHDDIFVLAIKYDGVSDTQFGISETSHKGEADDLVPRRGIVEELQIEYLPPLILMNPDARTGHFHWTGKISSSDDVLLIEDKTTITPLPQDANDKTRKGSVYLYGKLDVLKPIVENFQVLKGELHDPIQSLVLISYNSINEWITYYDGHSPHPIVRLKDGTIQKWINGR
jgi:hypothetical protein